MNREPAALHDTVALTADCHLIHADLATISAGLEIDAVVEENFPAEAMNSQLAFYAAESEAGYQANFSAMIESCARFIDFDRINVVPTSEYLVKSPW